MSEPDHGMSTERVDAKFIEGPSGPLFCLCASPEILDSGGSVDSQKGRLLRNDPTGESDGRHLVLFVPPFGEEVNLCRRFNSLLRARLSAAGLFSIQPDLYGTGDSVGHFEDATWEMWQADLEYVVQYCLSMADKGTVTTRLSIVAIRAGCLLTQQLITSSLFSDSRVHLENIVYIQPEMSGFDIVNRLFRARITAQRFAGNKMQTSADLWARIESGETVHAGGHALSSKLCRLLHDIKLELGASERFKHQVLFTLESRAGRQESTGWENIDIAAKPFWLSYDIEPDATLISTIAKVIEG